MNQGKSRGNKEEDISKVKLTMLGIYFDIIGWEKAESGDNSKTSSGIALTGTGNKRGGKGFRVDNHEFILEQFEFESLIYK